MTRGVPPDLHDDGEVSTKEGPRAGRAGATCVEQTTKRACSFSSERPLGRSAMLIRRGLPSRSPQDNSVSLPALCCCFVSIDATAQLGVAKICK